jgi:hypothetical protein
MRRFFFFVLMGISFFAVAAESESTVIFRCGRDFQRQLLRYPANRFVLSEGKITDSLPSSHAYFQIADSDLHWNKGKCQIKLHGQRIDDPSERVRGKRALYEFKFEFSQKKGPDSLIFEEEGRPAVSCEVEAASAERLKNCQLPTDLFEAFTCQSSVVEGTQVKTVFRYDPASGLSERQVFKVTDAEQAGEKSEDLGTRWTQWTWEKKKNCELHIEEKNTDEDHWMDFRLSLPRRLSSEQAGSFQRMRILIDSEHVADLQENKKQVLCQLSPWLRQQAAGCGAAPVAEKVLKPKKKTTKKKASGRRAK